MLIELSKREIEVIVELMNMGVTYSITHGDPQFRVCKVDNNVIISNPLENKPKEKIINTNDLMERLKEKIK